MGVEIFANCAAKIGICSFKIACDLHSIVRFTLGNSQINHAYNVYTMPCILDHGTEKI